MKHELKRVEPLRAANIGALVYGFMMAAMALIVLPFVLLLSMFAPAAGREAVTPLFAVVMLVAYPIFGVVIGWVSGFLTAAIYNLVIGWSGGLLVEFASSPPDLLVKSTVDPLPAS